MQHLQTQKVEQTYVELHGQTYVRTFGQNLDVPIWELMLKQSTGKTVLVEMKELADELEKKFKYVQR